MHWFPEQSGLISPGWRKAPATLPPISSSMEGLAQTPGGGSNPHLAPACLPACLPAPKPALGSPCSCCGPGQLFCNFSSLSQQPACMRACLSLFTPSWVTWVSRPKGKRRDGSNSCKAFVGVAARLLRPPSAAGEATRPQISHPVTLCENLSAKAKDIRGMILRPHQGTRGQG